MPALFARRNARISRATTMHLAAEGDHALFNWVVASDIWLRLLTMIEEKFQRMDELCNRMELVTSSLAGFVETGPLSHATTVTSVETNKAEALPNTDSEQERIPVRTHVEELDLEAFATAGTTLMDHIMASDSSGRQRCVFQLHMSIYQHPYNTGLLVVLSTWI